MQYRRHPVHLAQAVLICAALATAVHAQVPPGARLAGQGRLLWWGLPIYDASLWASPGFTSRGLARQTFLLELTYLRSLRGGDIARRSIEEMRRAGSFDPAQAARWQAQLEALLPDVVAGDRIAALHAPGRGAAFYVNGKPAGEIADALFAQLFFAIWLGPNTSEPRLRASLLKDTP
jgi:hypothetical protein